MKKLNNFNKLKFFADSTRHFGMVIMQNRQNNAGY